MSQALVSLVGKRMLAENVRNKFGTEDPYFEQVPASRLGRTFGKKTTKRRKAIPPGVSEHDAKILTKVKRRAYQLDYALFNLCGIRFGWGSVIGLVPFIGDAGDAALAMMVVRNCQEIEGGLPSSLRMMMVINVLIDFVIGLVPFIGDLADAVYKCNTRNAVILEKHLRGKGAKNIKKQPRQPSTHGRVEEIQEDTVDHSLPDEWDKQESGVVNSSPPEYREHTVPDGRRGEGPGTQQTQQQPRPNRGFSKWFGGASRQQEDLEQGR